MRSAEEMIAYALEMDVSMLPYAAELLVDFDELGSDAELIADVIRGLDLPVGACVVDLGSGKGAVTLEIARETGFSTVGIELFEPFVRSARALAESAGVARQCRFVHGDVPKMAGQVGEFDVMYSPRSVMCWVLSRPLSVLSDVMYVPAATW